MRNIKLPTKLPDNFKIDPLDQWMAEAETVLDKYEGPRSGVFVDIGAHVGVVSVRAALQGFSVYSYEASKPNYDNLCFNMRSVSADQNLYNLAVTDRTGDEFTLYGFTDEGDRFNTGMRSTFYDSGKHRVESVVKTIAFQEILKSHERIQLLKVDIEGGEYDIFRPPDELAKLLSRVRYISLELHDLSDLNYFRGIDFKERFPWFDSPETALVEIVAFLYGIGFTDMTYEQVIMTNTNEFLSKNHNFNEASELKGKNNE